MSQERPRNESIRARRVSLAGVTDRLTGSVRTAAFWLAVLLPLAYLPVFGTFEGGVDDVLIVAALLALHVVALSLGHDYRRD